MESGSVIEKVSLGDLEVGKGYIIKDTSGGPTTMGQLTAKNGTSLTFKGIMPPPFTIDTATATVEFYKIILFNPTSKIPSAAGTPGGRRKSRRRMTRRRR